MVTWSQIQGLYKMALNLQLGDQKKLKFKETAKKCDLTDNNWIQWIKYYLVEEVLMELFIKLQGQNC